MTEDARSLEEMPQRVIAWVTEARERLDKSRAKAQAVRARGDLNAQRKQQELDEIVKEARAVTTAAVREPRSGVSGGWTVGRTVPPGPGVVPWFQGLGAAGQTAKNEMLAYIASAERVFEVDLQELQSGAAPPAGEAASRSSAAAEVASYEAAHPAPAGIPSAAARRSS